MEKIAIITDSCSDIKKEYRELYDIHVLPIQIQYDGKSYRDGVDITSNDIYAIQDEKVIKKACLAHHEGCSECMLKCPFYKKGYDKVKILYEKNKKRMRV